jgi:hypothetical protein
MCFENMDKPRIQVDFNELVQEDVVLLSKIDEVVDSAGNKILLSEGMKVSVYEYNYYESGEKEYLLAEGVAELNNLAVNGEWSKAAKWCCRIDKNGITSQIT